ncbi:integrator complex subunit 12-like [Phymastichus coffea]|uniref:integrator complex subunit 12-like n=1 Tax=Phymastichus coffea TaxID=108790 RepID=UPI00273B2971|nr:integrator complex subunit 12-like [Phymastichus coffea]XP_058789158.1 integrator complex subunit 12-like [Phymastichus coffea]XP_058789159.1 integrator complex subunit 12-like [Phymastichus coffea]XP_058789160.1 integrator complex subunit 12-like [Phymastichus coffea]
MERDPPIVESKKATKAEHEKSLSKEFIRALSLLYSPEANSAEELRLMLEIEIAKQKKLKQTKLRKYQQRLKRRKACAADIVGSEHLTAEKSSRPQTKQTIADKKAQVIANLEPAAEDFANKDDIPIISIPDEDQNDEAVCKVCNVPGFGPLTLTQCNACEKYYHQLCHQPPIVDACLQEFHSLWHCEECKNNKITKVR